MSRGTRLLPGSGRSPRRGGLPAGRSAALVLLLLSVAGGWAPLEAQGVRGWVQSWVRYMEMQPLQLDTALAGDVVYDANGDARVDGRLIWCTQTPCNYYRPAPIQTATLGSQDVGFTAWGFGMTGLSATVLLRARDHFSGELDWPLADDPLDVLVAYGELRQGAWRLRAGRQAAPSGLGFAGFDGASVRRDGGSLWAEAFGGRSLQRGLNEPAREALRGIEAFVRDQEAYLVGAAAGYRWGVSGIGLRYQREIYSDRGGLVSERGSMDFHTVLPWSLRLRGAADYDFAFGQVGKANLTLQRGLFDGRLISEFEVRRYVPYFELNTIWGFFSPVPFHEARVQFSAGLARGAGLQVALAAREYDDPNATVIFRPLENQGYRAEVATLWTPLERVQVDLGYDLDWGAASFLHAFDGSVRVDWTSAFATRAFATSFQQFETFRLGDGRAFGGGLALEWTVTSRVLLDGNVSMIRNDGGRGGPGDEWNQTRASFGLRYEFGEDPGLRRRRP